MPKENSSDDAEGKCFQRCRRKIVSANDDYAEKMVLAMSKRNDSGDVEGKWFQRIHGPCEFHGFQPAISNIKNHVSITLEMENVQYSTWAKLFKIHARSHRVIDHINAPTAGTEKRPQQEEDKELWSTLDATVLQWLYATISHDFLHTIFEPDTTVMEAWNRLRDIFQDNKHSRAFTLEYDFTHVDMTDFLNVSSYCQHLKSMVDQLKNVSSPVANDRLVLQLISRLTEPYQGVAPLIRHRDPLPQFYQARSMFTLEEADCAKKAAQISSAALVARSSEGPPNVPDNSSSNHNTNSGKRNHN
ncbi:uncharacterized protein LOC129903592 [Solanum dulcamara]|uniref:uncharacterized protein LOC129903592 n=1 Tax=Solanum dulcamara TaxID=45834 RepID=UPI0024851ECE|nr:uncharacterized protein LOC129903592 [Solanum dulcamara]